MDVWGVRPLLSHSPDWHLLPLAKTTQDWMNMELWNDYEGKLLDGQFRLERLIGPKGRSAFFATSDKTGKPAIVRVIESLNDEDEILARWTAVRQMNEPNLVEILACNKTVLDGVHLVYAVLEATDAELADLLRERALSPDETRQMATSVVTALEALHAQGFIHEHVEAESVLAKGEEVKLRGDCVREAPEGTEGETLRRRDTHDLAMLVGYALTQRRDVGQTKLPRPFDDFVRNGMAGTWGLKEMGAVVRPVAVVSAPAAVPTSTAVAKSLQGKGLEKGLETGPLAMGAPSQSAVGPKAVPSRPPNVAPLRPAVQSAGAASAQAVAASLAAAPQMPTRRPVADDRVVLEPEEDNKSRTVFWAALAVVAILLISLIWHFTHVSDSSAKTSSPVANVAPAPESASIPVAPVVPTKPSAATGTGRTAGRVAVTHGAGPAGSQWRLVAYTFNREEAAQKKAEAIAQVHPALKPEVFTPSGRPPYLVALGGWMTVEQASALKAKARAEGLPHDIYTQNYRGH